MKKLAKLFILISLPLLVKPAGGDIIKIRDLYYKASTNKKDAETFSAEMKTVSGIAKSLIAGYTGMSLMIKANFAFNPYYKLNYFIKGKDLLDNAITADPTNVELRFLRFCVQTNAPAFLGYSGKITEDKRVIVLGYHQLEDKDLSTRISEYMEQSKSCSKEEKVVFLMKK